METSPSPPDRPANPSLKHKAEQSVGYWLTRATHAYHRALCDQLAPHGITYRQSMVVSALMVEGEMSQAELASRLMIEPPTLVGILDRMQRDGWITRRNCPTDRRKNLVHLTPAAEPVWEKIKACFQRIRSQATRDISDADLESLKSLLRHIHQNVEQLGPDAADDSTPRVEIPTKSPATA